MTFRPINFGKITLKQIQNIKNNAKFREEPTQENPEGETFKLLGKPVIKDEASDTTHCFLYYKGEYGRIKNIKMFIFIVIHIRM